MFGEADQEQGIVTPGIERLAEQEHPAGFRDGEGFHLMPHQPDALLIYIYTREAPDMIALLSM